jgi:excinuclease UvrABC ATPase subunit
MKRRYLVIIFWLFLFVGGNLLAQRFQYVGASACKKCHNIKVTGDQHMIWSEGPHANAMESLSSEKARTYANEHNIVDPTTYMGCLKCHSTAGNIAANLRTRVTIEEGVSCESCHGPGSAYASDEIMKDRKLSIKNGLIIPTTYTCEQCHNNYNPFFIKPFDFNESVKIIAHNIPKPPEK